MAESDDILEPLKSHYEPRMRRYSNSYRILDWESPTSQRKRFQILLENVPVSGKSLLDVGCGLGDLYAYLLEQGVETVYTGVDILEGMIERARKRHPAGNFLLGNIFDRGFMHSRKFDLLYCSGIFNLKIGDNALLLKRALDIFFALARETVVFNLLDAKSPDRDDRYYYFSQDEVRTLLLPFDWDTQIIGDYLPNDFTVICRNA